MLQKLLNSLVFSGEPLRIFFARPAKPGKGIAQYCEQESHFEKSEIEIDGSYFGARRVRGIRRRGTRGKQIVFGHIKREEVASIPKLSKKNCSVASLLPI